MHRCICTYNQSLTYVQHTHVHVLSGHTSNSLLSAVGKQTSTHNAARVLHCMHACPTLLTQNAANVLCRTVLHAMLNDRMVLTVSKPFYTPQPLSCALAPPALLKAACSAVEGGPAALEPSPIQLQTCSKKAADTCQGNPDTPSMTFQHNLHLTAHEFDAAVQLCTPRVLRGQLDCDGGPRWP